MFPATLEKKTLSRCKNYVWDVEYENDYSYIGIHLHESYDVHSCDSLMRWFPISVYKTFLNIGSIITSQKIPVDSNQINTAKCQE